MTQQTDPWDIPPPSHGAPLPLIPRLPAPQTAAQREHERLSNIALSQTIEQDSHRLDPATVDMIAHQYILAGPSALQNVAGRGRAGQANRDAILNRAAQLAGTRPGENVQVGFARYRNGVHALQTLENQLGTISGNEQSARGYAEQALSALRAVAPDNSWAPTNWIRNLAGDTTNDPNLGTWDTARNTFLTEYGKVVAGSPSGAGVLSDSARQEQMAVLRRTTNPQQAAAIIEQMSRDMNIRLQALQTNIQRGYSNLENGHPVSFSPQGEMLDERGGIVPLSGRRDNGDAAPPPFTGTNQHPSGPAGGAGGTPPAGRPPSGERMDQTTVNMGQRGPDNVSLNTSAMQRVADPMLAGVNAHINAMLHNGDSEDAIRGYARDRGVQITPAFNADLHGVVSWRDDHPNFRGAYDVQLDQHLVPQSLGRQVLTNFGDSPYGAATLHFGNFLAGQQLPQLTSDPELTQAGLNEITNRHPVASVAGDVAGGAAMYAGGTRAVEAGLAATERLAPSVFSRLPAWVRGGTAAGEEAGAYSAEAASARTLAPTLAPRAIAGDTAIGAYESPGNRGEGALIGGMTGAGFRGTVNTAGRAVSPSGGDLAPFYEEGGQPSLGQRFGAAQPPTSAADIGGWAAHALGRGINRAEQAFQSIPLVGGIQRSTRDRAIDQWQLGGFNRALRNLPDEPQLPAGMQPGTEPHAFSQGAFDTAYNRVHQRINVVDDPELQQGLTEVRQEATRLSDPSLSHFNRIIDNSVLRRLQNGEGALTGDELQQTMSEIRRTARSLRSNPTGDRELADSLDDLAGVIHDNAARHSPPEAIQTLNNINRGYGMLVRIENAANRGGAGDPGEYTAKGLMTAERQQGGLRGRQFLAGNGLMTDYARAGLKLGQTVPDSGTFERAATVGSMAAAGHFISPYAAAPWALDTIANAPGVRSVVDWISRPNRAAVRPFTDELRSQIQSIAGIGSKFGAPGVVALYSDQRNP